MSPSLKQSDHKNKTIRLTHNSIVISFRRTDTYFVSNNENNLVLKQLESGKSDNHYPTPALSLKPSEPHSYYSAAHSVQCTCGPYDGWALFKQFLNENSMSAWNPYLISCLTQLEFLGFLHPLNLLIGGTDFCLEVIRSSWARRVLKPPKGFQIEFIGDISSIETSIVNQTQFTPLSEALCKCINELNIRRITANFETIVKRLQIEFPNMELPSEKVLKNSLKTLVQNKKLHYDHQKDCFIAPSYHYKLDNSLEELESLSLREQHLLTGEEAFTRLHGKTTHYGSDDEIEESSVSKKSWTGQTDIDCSLKKRDSLASTGNSSTYTQRSPNYSDNSRQMPSNSALRRSSSLRLESNKLNNSNDSRHSTFKRSRSFKIHRKKHEIFEPQESSTSTSGSTSTTDNCNKCKVDSTRKQSVLSKFLRLGTSGNVSKSKSSASKSAHFSSQFPESNSAVIAFNRQIDTKSIGTQTVKYGPDDYTVIIKQASRHALAKNGSHRTNNNKDCEQNNSRCRCLDRDSYSDKHQKHNKSSNRYKYGNKLEISTTPMSAMSGGMSPMTHISPIAAIPISVPISECILCNEETQKLYATNGHDLTDNNNYWSKANHQLFRQINGSHGFDYPIKQNERLNHNLVNQRNGGLPLFMRGTSFKEQRTDQTPEDKVESHHNYQSYPQTAKNVLSPQPTRLNNSTSLIERANPNANKTQLLNTTLDSEKSYQNKNRFKENLSTLNNQSNQTIDNNVNNNTNNNNNNNNNLYVDSSLNVQIEIGSTATTKIDETSPQKSNQKINDCITNFNQTNAEISANIQSSNTITRTEEQSETETSVKQQPSVTTATTVTTSMSFPNGYHNNYSNTNTNGFNKNIDWVQLPTDVTNGVKSLKICNEDNERTNLSNNKQNNLLSQIKINSMPHLSPIRQKVAKAKAEFFNSTSPQTPLVTNLLIEK